MAHIVDRVYHVPLFCFILCEHLLIDNGMSLIHFSQTPVLFFKRLIEHVFLQDATKQGTQNNLLQLQSQLFFYKICIMVKYSVKLKLSGRYFKAYAVDHPLGLPKSKRSIAGKINKMLHVTELL